jgi:hypothetical protein
MKTKRNKQREEWASQRKAITERRRALVEELLGQAKSSAELAAIDADERFWEVLRKTEIVLAARGALADLNTRKVHNEGEFTFTHTNEDEITIEIKDRLVFRYPPVGSTIPCIFEQGEWIEQLEQMAGSITASKGTTKGAK